jgi:hypothetical protein
MLTPPPVIIDATWLTRVDFPGQRDECQNGSQVGSVHGGSLQGNAHAQADSWERIIEFFSLTNGIEPISQAESVQSLV